ncbi:hypothetical protein NMY22_g8482 [Coprinellus aureogranulatus]|nr:hypothetical protein NMY22_g8482 [Coprinellus aureogranulatus]
MPPIRISDLLNPVDEAVQSTFRLLPFTSLPESGEFIWPTALRCTRTSDGNATLNTAVAIASRASAYPSALLERTPKKAPLACSVCGTLISGGHKWNLKRHMKIHARIEKLSDPCHFCGKVVPTGKSYERHLRSHDENSK